MLLFLLGGMAAFADDVEFDVTGLAWGTNYSAKYPGTNNVTLKGRTFVANEWTGLCLPFDASKEVLDEAFGKDMYNIQSFKSMEQNNIYFGKVTDVKSATPYFIKVKKDVSEPIFKGVTFVSAVDTEWKLISISDKLTFRGFYFTKRDDEMYDQNNNKTINYFWMNADGTLSDFRAGEVVWSEKGRIGVNAYLFMDGYASVSDKPNLVFEGQTSGGGSGETGGEGGDSEDQTSLSYKIKNKLQLTDVPTIYLVIPDVVDLDKDLTKDRGTNTALYHKATINVVDKNGTLEEFEDDKLDIKVRGNSTAEPSKRAYRLKFGKDEKDKTTGEVVKTHKHDLMGGGYAKRNWALLANCFDHSLIRNALTCELGKIIGMPFNPGYCFVDLVINNDYRGTYQVTDHPEVGSHRIDIDEDKDWYIEFQGAGGSMLDEPYISDVKDCPAFNIKNPDYTDEADAEKLEQLKADMRIWAKEWASVFNSTPIVAQSDIKGWRAYNDEDQLLKWIIDTEITADYDGYMTIKAYRAPDGKLFWGPVWDKDLAWDNYGDYANVLAATIGTSTIKTLVYNNNAGNTLLGDPRFMKRIYETYNQLLDDGLEQKLLDVVDKLHQRVDQTQKLNFEKWGITNVYGGGLEKYHEWTDYAKYPEQLKSFIKARLAFLKTKFQEIYDVVCKTTSATYIPENNWWGTELTTCSFLDQTVKGRTFTANQWNTYCMPFEASQEQIKDALGDDVQVVSHVGLDLDAQTMLFAPVTGDLKAGYPYFVKPSKDVVNPVFKNVINTETANQGESYNGQSVSFDGKHFIYGTLFKGYTYIDTSEDILFADDVYNDANSFTNIIKKYGNGANYVNGARAFLRIPDGEGETPSIKILSAEEAKKFTYDVTNSYVHTAWCQYDNETKDVSLANRGTLWGNEWNMICLPFKLASSAYKKVFGNDVKVAEFTGVTKSEGGDVLSFDLSYINEKNGMKAATPYLIMPSKDIPTADLTFEGVKVSVKTTAEQASGDENFKLYGTLAPTLLNKGHQQIVLMRNNQLQYMAPYSESTKPMQACRAYFEAVSTSDVTAAKSFQFSIDGVVTDVKMIDADVPSDAFGSSNAESGKVYNLNGQLVGTSTDNLPQGIYVVAGKKVVK